MAEDDDTLLVPGPILLRLGSGTPIDEDIEQPLRVDGRVPLVLIIVDGDQEAQQKLADLGGDVVRLDGQKVDGG